LHCFHAGALDSEASVKIAAAIAVRFLQAR
jgi:hypothetical protein